MPPDDPLNLANILLDRNKLNKKVRAYLSVLIAYGCVFFVFASMKSWPLALAGAALLFTLLRNPSLFRNDILHSNMFHGSNSFIRGWSEDLRIFVMFASVLAYMLVNFRLYWMMWEEYKVLVISSIPIQYILLQYLSLVY